MKLNPKAQSLRKEKKSKASPPAVPAFSNSEIEIFCRKDGAPMRSLMNGRSPVDSVSYTSGRFGCSIEAEAATEMGFVRKHEVVTDYVRARAQPCRYKGFWNGRLHSAIPDKLVQRADGSWWIEDYKRDWSGFDQENGRRQIALGERAAAALGIGYRARTLANVGNETLRDNIELVQIYRFHPIGTQHLARIGEAFYAKSEVTVGALANVLAPNPLQGFAAVCAMMVHRQIRIDLSRPLKPSSNVTRVAPLPAWMPSAPI